MEGEPHQLLIEAQQRHPAPLRLPRRHPARDPGDRLPAARRLAERSDDGAFRSAPRRRSPSGFSPGGKTRGGD
jgi:hypothetical protein